VNIVISGTSKGIGNYLANYYLDKGHRVFGCSRNEAGITSELYTHFKLDVQDEPAVLAMFGEILEKGGADALINNAGVASMNHIITTPMETVRSVFGINVFGSFLMLREAAKQMMTRRSGRIVNMLTVATPLLLEGETIYGASKAAMEHITRTAAKELASYGITVNGVGCTPLQTDLIKNVPEEKMNALLGRQAIQRYAVMQDVSNVIDFFLREESSYITSQVINLGGVVA
jgi:3-oxoacyl-[acyl-carrier protein] reductase